MIKLLKSGQYALEGVNVVDMVAGQVVDFGPKENCNLVEIKWAQWHKEEAKTAEKDEPQEFEKRRPGRPAKA